MRTLVGFFRLPRGERRFVFRSWGVLIRTALWLRIHPMPRLLRAIDTRIVSRRPADRVAPEAALRLLRAAARRIWPRPTCLITALAGYELLHEQGWPVAIVIGARATAGDFTAHAWLEHDGLVVLGAPTALYEPVWRWPIETSGQPAAGSRQFCGIPPATR